jgi:serine protease AprX
MRRIFTLILASFLVSSYLPGIRVVQEKEGLKKSAKFSPGVKKLRFVNEFQDVRWADLTKMVSSLSKELIATLWFNRDTQFGGSTEFSLSILEKGKNPGLGVRSLHRRGITGKGVSVAIVDQNLCLNHPEFKGKVAEYKDIGCGQPADQGSMHAPGVMSLLAGSTIGTAPAVRVFFAAAPSWTADAKYQADALEWIVEKNRVLPQNDKIRVVSVSAAPSGKGSPFKKNNEAWDTAVEKAEKEGILVLDCTLDHGIIGPCYYDPEDPDNLGKCQVGFPGLPGSNPLLKKRVGAPCSYRTTAEEYNDGYPSYQYCGRGGLSWSIPYAAGVLALGWQVRPDLKPEAIIKLLFETAHVTSDGYKIINPVVFIEAVGNLSVTK